jgi:molybdopterin-guanine dinucleotide biosynthesis protein A
MRIDAIVLAGGASSRFGADKLTADLGGRPLLDHAIEACAAIADRLVVVIAPGSPEPPLPASVMGRTIVVRDAVAHRGPLAGLAAGLDSVTGSEIAVVVGGDMPWLVPEVLRLLVERLVIEPSLGAARLEAEPRCVLPMAVRTRAAAPAARALLVEDRRALGGLLDRIESATVPAGEWRRLDPAGRTLTDVDTPQDLGLD